MRCPICGKKVINVISNINHPADILGCDECLPPELDSEDLIDVFDTDPEWEAYKEGEYSEDGYDRDGYDRDGYSRANWDKWNADEDYAIEMAHSSI